MSVGTMQQPATQEENFDVDLTSAQSPEQEKHKITKRGRRRGRHGRRKGAAGNGCSPLVIDESSEEDGEVPVLEAFGLTPTQGRQRRNVVTWGDLGGDQPTASTTATTTAAGSPVGAASLQAGGSTGAVAGWWHNTSGGTAQMAAVPYRFAGFQGGDATSASSITTIHVGGTAHHGINWEAVHWGQGVVHTADCRWPQQADEWTTPSLQQADQWTPEHSEALKHWLCQRVGGDSPARVEEMLTSSAPSVYED